MSMLSVIEEGMHTIGQELLMPAIIVLVAMMVIVVWKVGGFAVECILERRKFVANIPKLLKAINDHEIVEVQSLIENSGLLKRQRKALLMLLENKTMTKTAMTALAESLLVEEELRYQKSLEISEIIVKIGPMIGLLGTLIPLGPGLEALGAGNVAILSKSLLIAFDATIAGLACAGISYVIVVIRRRWYNHYVSQLETIMVSLMEKIHPEEGSRMAEEDKDVHSGSKEVGISA